MDQPTGHVSYMGDMRNIYKILVGISEGKLFERTRIRQKDNIRMDLRAIL
jgi:hypothetical protein